MFLDVTVKLKTISRWQICTVNLQIATNTLNVTNLKHHPAVYIKTFCIIQRITSKVTQFDLRFTLCNLQVIHANVILLTARLVKMLKNVMSFLVMKTFKIKHYFVGNSKSLIFQMPCKLCSKLYVQFTIERFRFQRNNYKSCQRKAEREILYTKVPS